MKVGKARATSGTSAAPAFGGGLGEARDSRAVLVVVKVGVEVERKFSK